MQAIDDKVWASVSAREGRLRRRTSTMVMCLAIGLTLALGGVALLDRYGAFRSRVSVDEVGWGGEFVYADGDTSTAMVGSPPSPIVRSSFYVTNTGWSDVRILGVEVHGDGFEFRQGLAGVIHRTSTGFASGPGILSPTDAYRLAPGENASFSVEVHITDCRIVVSPDVVLTVDSWRGVARLVRALPRIRHDNGGWRATSVADPEGIDGLRYLADLLCSPRSP